MGKALADQRSYEYLMATLSKPAKEYVSARAQGATPVAAAQSAGYDDPIKSATKNEQNMQIRSAIETALRMQQRETKLTRDDIIAGFMDAVNMAASSAELVQAWREIGRIIGAYEPQKVQIDVNARVTHEQVSQMSDDELAKLAAVDGEFVVLEDVHDVEPIPREA